MNIVTRPAVLGALTLAAISLSGCGIGGPGTGERPLGAARPFDRSSTTGGSPLGSPFTGQLPLVPGDEGPGKGSGSGQFAGTPGSSAGQAIKQAAYQLPVPFPYKPGTENGNLGCADVVCTALENAGVTSASEHQLSVDGTRTMLRGKGWQDVEPPPFSDGDVIIWAPTSGGTHQHIGIIVIENGQVFAIHNSSSQRRPIKVLLSSMNRGVKNVLRSPGGAA